MVKHNFWTVKAYLKKNICKKKKEKNLQKKYLCKIFAQRPEKWGFRKKKS